MVLCFGRTRGASEEEVRFLGWSSWEVKTSEALADMPGPEAPYRVREPSDGPGQLDTMTAILCVGVEPGAHDEGAGVGATGGPFLELSG